MKFKVQFGSEKIDSNSGTVRSMYALPVDREAEAFKASHRDLDCWRTRRFVTDKTPEPDAYNLMSAELADVLSVNGIDLCHVEWPHGSVSSGRPRKLGK